MSRLDLDTFHDTSRTLDFVGPLESLLGEFKRGNIAHRDRTIEESAIQTHLAEHIRAWDNVFPEFPDLPWKRRTITWENHRGRRDTYLERLIAAAVPKQEASARLIVNPATVAGMHPRRLARALPDFEIIGTDITSRWERLYRIVLFFKHRGLHNYRFVRESIFEPDLQRRPAAVVLFGSCGSLTDAAMDYAIVVDSPFLICRSCCHENISGNTEIVRRRRMVNYFFALKNFFFSIYKKEQKGYHFNPRYYEDAYPRSEAARAIMDSATILAAARNAPDSDICRFLIDLDRCLFLQENGYDVMYREELFFAHKNAEPVDVLIS